VILLLEDVTKIASCRIFQEFVCALGLKICRDCSLLYGNE